MVDLKDKLESIYSKYNKREYVDPDPLLFLYDYHETRNIEIAGLIAACFAYGRVEQIMKTIALILAKLNPSPFDYLMDRTRDDIADDFKGFRYRFANDLHLTSLLWGIREVLHRFSSLENCFCAGWSPEDKTVLPGLLFFCDQIRQDRELGHLLADPKKKSACKRSHLFLRWMVRDDLVDPGIWEHVSPSMLIIPLDTHMYKTGTLFGFTSRKSQDIKTALEITQGFRMILREDPVKYDFCLTRFGIRKELSMDHLRMLS
ncbi:MAG: TIGR02757 family protein [Thermodesulfobacteriota bacterium]|nr:TIGR02757 family protein [Thermodesulfobacteriota bacterium]